MTAALREAPFVPLLELPGALRIRFGAAVVGRQMRHAEVMELLLAEELERAVFDRAGFAADADTQRNALAAFLASKVYGLSGRFTAVAARLLLPEAA